MSYPGSYPGSPSLTPMGSPARKGSSSRRNTKYVLVTGGVLSGIGKGVIASSTGVLLKSRGLRVTSVKIDPYLNMDAGTMSPFEHGEVYVLSDGGEVDLDLGNYERFLDVQLRGNNNITTGKIYKQVIERERRGDYLGKTVQVVPHITDCIQEWVEKVARTPVDGDPHPPDVCVIELGGTVGDIESMPFVEAMRQFQFRVGRSNFALLHVSLIPVLGVVGEQKTKPTQHGVQQLRALGLSPDFLMCRSQAPLSASTQEKLALFCHVDPSRVIGVHDVSNIYRVPILLEQQLMADQLLAHFQIAPVMNIAFWEKWQATADLVDNVSSEVVIGLVGKYNGLSDSYLSVIKALQHAAMGAARKLVIRWVSSADLEPVKSESEESQEKYEKAWADLKSCDGIIVPGGFGDRGTEGKILAIEYARKQRVPFLGVCLGMQLAVVEYARNVLGIKDAHSAELEESTPDPVIIFMPEISTTHMGGTMRLGNRSSVIGDEESLVCKLYGGAKCITERHRHRYEVNVRYVPQLEEKGLLFTAQDETGERMEVVEIEDHPYFLAVQFHPEFLSRPTSPSPPFLGLLLASSGQLSNWLATDKFSEIGPCRALIERPYNP